METVDFCQMKDGTQPEYEFLAVHEQRYIESLPERLLRMLESLDSSLDGYKVSRLEHSLQSATRVEDDGADEEMIVATLLHDIGDIISPANHAEVAAAILRPYVRPEVAWIVEKHGEFQMYYWAHHLGGDQHARDKYRDHAHYQACVDFCEKYDQSSFDPDYPTKPLRYFEPMLRRVMGKPRYPAS